MKYLLLIVRFPAVMIILGLTPVVAFVGNLLIGAKPDKLYRWKCLVMQRASALMFRVCGGRLRVVGEPPSPPFILVSNHLGYMDIITMNAVVPGYYISKSEVYDWPIVGGIVRHTNVLLVNRSDPRDLLRLKPVIKKIVDDGQGVVFYPEGTSTRGETVRPFMPSLFEAAAKNEIPVHYASITYKTGDGEPAADMAVCWWGDMDFLPHLLGLIQLKSFQATLTFGRDSLCNSNRKILANDLRNAVFEIFTPVVNQEKLCTTR
jgi:1-acyl-sn-glycerol-3-phosphate acyltransferase